MLITFASPLDVKPIMVEESYHFAKGNNLHPEWDAANTELGKLVILDEKNKLRVHGGVLYARIKTSRLTQ